MNESADVIAKQLLVGNDKVCGSCAYLSCNVGQKLWHCWSGGSRNNQEIFLDTPSCEKYMYHVIGNGKAYEEEYRMSHVKELKLVEKHDKWLREMELSWEGKKFSLLDKIKYKMMGI